MVGGEQLSSSFGRTKKARCPLLANTSNYIGIVFKGIVQYIVNWVLRAACVLLMLYLQ